MKLKDNHMFVAHQVQFYASQAFLKLSEHSKLRYDIQIKVQMAYNAKGIIIQLNI